MAEKKEKQQVFDDAIAFFKSVKCKPWPGDCSKESDALLCALKMASESLEPDGEPQQEEHPETDWKAMYLSEKERNELLPIVLWSFPRRSRTACRPRRCSTARLRPSLRRFESQGQKKSRWERLKIAWKG